MPGPRKRTPDERLQSWLDWYDKNQARSEYRRTRYALMTEEQRQQQRDRKKATYKKRIAEGWSGPYRKGRVDVVMYRMIALNFLIQRDGRSCGICGKEVEIGQESFDHIIPRAMGGGDEPSNIRLAHRVCNTRRPRKPKDLRLQQEAEKPVLN